MSFIDDVRSEREELARVLKKHTGIRRIVEDLYPDSAHFIYELLQNAEDTGATQAHFALGKDGLIFEHNGRPFEPNDIAAITDIGEGTKAGDDDKIGRFGVGFKAVFAYSETPHIWSPTFSFKITELVLPSELPSADDLVGRTRFEFPFNNPKKPAKDAFKEVEKGLSELAEMTLLFLSHLKSVSWQIDGGVFWTIVRSTHSQNHFEILKQSDGKTKDRSHFLKFDQPVKGLPKQRAALAFELDFLPKCENFDSNKPLAEQMKIISANPGQVAVFFPAHKEASGFRFHLHAPFVPELSRASIKDTPANQPLFEQLAELAAASLHQIRDLSLLTAEFLEVLPNSEDFPDESSSNQDDIDERYASIYKSIVDEMNEEPLTPTHYRSHAPAKHLVQGKVSLKSLLSDQDLKYLLDYDVVPWRWAIGVRQNTNADRFMKSLAVGNWDVDELVDFLKNNLDSTPQSEALDDNVQGIFMDWLNRKTIDWHQALYGLLWKDYLDPEPYQRESLAAELSALKIVRLTDGTYGSAKESFFVTDSIVHDEDLVRVDPMVYSTGTNKQQKENARKFLIEIGVREVDECVLVETILSQRYTFDADPPDDKTYKKDLKRFVSLVEKQPGTASLFSESFIFKCGDYWRKPEPDKEPDGHAGVFLDKTFLETGLNAYYGALGDDADRFALCDNYDYGITPKRLAKFAQAVGAATCLEIQQTDCSNNPNEEQLGLENGGRHGRINMDYHIPGLGTLFEDNPNIELSQLIWRTLCNQVEDSWMVATFRSNLRSEPRTAPSQLVCVLTESEWIPQTGGRFVRPSDATRDDLPKGFAFDSGWTWLEAIQFGQQQAERSAGQLLRQTMAKQLGFNDEGALERAQRFAELPADEQERFLNGRKSQPPIELPDHELSNPSRRVNKVKAQAADAPKRLTNEITRSVSVGLGATKGEAEQYLRQQYTNNDDQMICQVCKDRLPFKLDDGSDYFERVELLCNLKRHHQQNYLALCPNHAAMFMYANGSTNELQDLVINLAGNEMKVVLATEDMTIYFTKAHLADLKAIISVDLAESETTENESADTTKSSG
jgi:hypothetical protein